MFLSFHVNILIASDQFEWDDTNYAMICSIKSYFVIV